MELIADILLVAGALGAGLYCFVLSRRLRRFTDLEKGVGGAVAVLSTQADELKKSLGAAREASDQSGEVLKDLTQRAESVAQRLELMMASMHDVIPPEDKTAKPTEPEPVKPREDTGDSPDEHKESATPETAEETSTPTKAKRPGGLMFLRHGRTQNEAAT
ncbi:DUF6468 domain-containing protein [Ruegeria halocynthiae]|uniref:DUF6468 domain-containing protein n=1 Tax=Ruegeria halocynthiae TaxID=985054 RepID=UPI00056B0E0F|nr:DUF6468 domain-containing protein [Ruegeria halocynthiae]